MILRKIIPGLAVFAAAVVVIVLGVVFTTGADTTVSQVKKADNSSDLLSAEAKYDLNNASASYAPQQQVVNGWYTNDLLKVLAETISESSEANTSIANNQQKLLQSNRRLMGIVWISIALLLIGFGAYLTLREVLGRDQQKSAPIATH